MARLVGINHVALEVADLDEALAWYGQFFELELRGRIGSQMAFVDLGDQLRRRHSSCNYRVLLVGDSA
jgi:catechol 2,3-dioxygenase-like lactoylglutathione lyase family enzyme